MRSSSLEKKVFGFQRPTKARTSPQLTKVPGSDSTISLVVLVVLVERESKKLAVLNAGGDSLSGNPWVSFSLHASSTLYFLLSLKTARVCQNHPLRNTIMFLQS